MKTITLHQSAPVEFQYIRNFPKTNSEKLKFPHININICSFEKNWKVTNKNKILDGYHKPNQFSDVNILKIYFKESVSYFHFFISNIYATSKKC